MKILIVDDHPLFRKGISSMLIHELSEVRIFEAENGEKALDVIKYNAIDLILLDLSMPVMDGFALLSHLQKTRSKNFKIIALTFYNEPSIMYRLLNFDVDGYLTKNIDLEIILEAIENVFDGKLYYPKGFDEKITGLIHSKKIPSNKLSPKEFEIIKLLSDGKTSKEIAKKLGYTTRTVETKRSRLEKKFFVKNSTELISAAYRFGVLKLEYGTND